MHAYQFVQTLRKEIFPWEIPNKVCSRMHIDFAGPLNKNYYLIITDALSKWPEVFKTREITSNFTINKLREVCSRFGLPDIIVSDNGTQFASSIFNFFLILTASNRKLQRQVI